MSETDFWNKTVRPAFAPYGDLVRIENRVGSGTPDVNYCLLRVEGWIELKKTYWPKKDNTKLLLPHFTDKQLRWHERRHKAGGRTSLLAQISHDYFLLPPWHLAEVFEGMVKQRYIECAVVHEFAKFPKAPLLRFLTGKGPVIPK